jgi:hypothetical protein|tara:strand:+ start:3136 stop:3261 length:126 start_codon:yes stop_codon:yes gene_type:complete
MEIILPSPSEEKDRIAEGQKIEERTGPVFLIVRETTTTPNT